MPRASTAARKKKQPVGGLIRNPATGRLVKRTGAIGRRLLASSSRRRKKKKAPAPGMIRNPATGRLVKRTGAIGRRLLASSSSRRRKQAKAGVSGVRYVVTAGARTRGGRDVRTQFTASARTQRAAVRAVLRRIKAEGLVHTYVYVEERRVTSGGRPERPPQSGSAASSRQDAWEDASAGDKHTAVISIGRGVYQGFGKTRAAALRDLRDHVVPPQLRAQVVADRVRYRKRR